MPREQRSDTGQRLILPKLHVLRSVVKNAFYTPVNRTDLTIFPFYLTFLHKAEASTPLGKNTFLSNRQSKRKHVGEPLT